MTFGQEVSRLLRRQDEESLPTSAEALFGVLYDELRRVARRYMGGQSPAHTLQPTALVHEAWMRVVKADEAVLEDRERFLAVAARAMRSVLVDSARRRNAQKRDGGERIPLEDILPSFEERAVDLVALDEALGQLAERSERAAQVVELRFFGGLSIEDTARVLNQSTATVERDWRSARAWLSSRLN